MRVVNGSLVVCLSEYLPLLLIKVEGFVLLRNHESP